MPTTPPDPTDAATNMMMETLVPILATACFLGGVGFMLAAAVGLVRMPDLFCRSHAVAKAMTLGVILMLLGLWLVLGQKGHGSGLKILLAIFFQVLTIPVAGHLLSQMGFEKKLPRWREPSSREKTGRESG